MKIDREQQRNILNLLFEQYPWKTNKTLQKVNEFIKEDEARAIGNLLYLQSHGLIDPYIEMNAFLDNCEQVDIALGDPIGTYRPYKIVSECPTITAKGIDFMLADGGLSAILNIQTIRLDGPSTKLLVNYFIEQSNLSEDERNSLREKLKSVPVAVLQESITKLLAEKISYQGVQAFLMNML